MQGLKTTKEIDISEQIHLVQTKEWNNFKRSYGTRVDYYENFYFLVKKIPFSKQYVAYAPKVNFIKQDINFKKLKKYCIKNNIAFVRFDVPNINLDTAKGQYWNKRLSKIFKISPRNTFTKQNLYLDISPTSDQLLKNMHQKRRYNIKYAEKRGIKIKIRQDNKALDNFYRLHSTTAKNQGFLTHSKLYFKTIQEQLKNNVYFIEASFKKEILVSWFVIVNKNTAYYVYGGSTQEYKNLHPSDLVGFNAITLAKSKGAKLFDFWGAEEGKGFTDFKRKYGTTTITYLPTYDLIINKFAYKQFNFLYQSFWKLQNLKKKIRS